MDYFCVNNPNIYIMKKITLFISVALLIGLTACGPQGKVKKFAESFAENVNDGNMDEVKEAYPDLPTDSLAAVDIDEIEVEQPDEDGVYRVNYNDDQWLDVTIDDGTIRVVDSRGIAGFPEDKYVLAQKTGMIKGSTGDIKANELLNDSTYFEWLQKKALSNLSDMIEMKPGKGRVTYGRDLYGRMCEGSTERMTVGLTNKTDKPISGKDYKITYTYTYETCSDGSSPPGHANGAKAGVDLPAGGSGSIEIAVMDYGIRNLALVYNGDKDYFFKNVYKPKGNEYSEYQQSLK